MLLRGQEVVMWGVGGAGRGDGRGPAHAWDLLRGAEVQFPAGTGEKVRSLCRCRRVGRKQGHQQRGSGEGALEDCKMRRLATVIQQSGKKDRPRKHTRLLGGTSSHLRPAMSFNSGQSVAIGTDKVRA